jgi:O-methyltransferase
VQQYGEISCTSFVKGWFDDTLPGFNEKLAGVYIDVDLVSSTKTCVKYFYPLLSSGGVMYSQDGHLPLVIEAINDDTFWEKEVGFKKPVIEGLNTSKLLRIVKP